MEHIYVTPASGEDLPHLDIIDRIEFDHSFRYGDVASEVAFLAVELECAGRPDLAWTFTDAYQQDMRDEGLAEALGFYKAYRALVRGHVRSLLVEQTTLTSRERMDVHAEAEGMFALAAHYATSPVEPVVVVLSGLMGSGKTSLARALSGETGWSVYSSDIVRKQLAGVAPASIVSAAHRRHLYTPIWDLRVYERLVDLAREGLQAGHSIILDASFSKRDWRRIVADVARNGGARAVFLECVCPAEVAIERLRSRWSAKVRLSRSGDSGVSSDLTLVSDGRPSLYRRQASQWEPFSVEESGDMTRFVIVTDTPLPHALERALAGSDYPRLMCRLEVGLLDQ